MDEEKRKAIGGRIMQAREALELKQVDVAGELGISRAHFRNFETGKAIPVYLLNWLSDKKISMDWIFTGTGEMFFNKVRFEKDVQQMLEDFEKLSALKHHMLSEYFLFLLSYVPPDYKDKKNDT